MALEEGTSLLPCVTLPLSDKRFDASSFCGVIESSHHVSFSIFSSRRQSQVYLCLQIELSQFKYPFRVVQLTVQCMENEL